MAYNNDANTLARYSLQLLRGQMVSQLVSGELLGGISLNEFMLGKPKPAQRSGKEIMNDALTGLIRSDAGMMRQASSNMSEGKTIMEQASTAVKSMGDKLGRMQEIAEAVAADPSLQMSLTTEYMDLAAGIAALVSSSAYNGIKLLDGSDWGSDQRITPSAGNTTGQLSLQAGKSPTTLTFYNLENFKTAFSAIDLNSPSAAALQISEYSTLINSMAESYKARAGLFEMESDSFKKQATILEEAAKRAKPNDEDSLKAAIIDLLLQDRGSIFSSKS